ncbi:MAG TPA: glycine--tRNA ligase subunit beta [Stellaceae bacterium]|nr:glycine--tRNA ligase subunit beta [Stellaceae bacterium]
MPDLLLELLTEEIPARMQKQAAVDLRRIVETKLSAAGLAFDPADYFYTPRRLALSITGLPLAQQDVNEERRGPRVGAPAPAVEGFLKSAGIASLAECEERDTGRGNFYFAVIRRPGRPTADLLAELLRAAIHELPWPKSMRFPAARFRWVRPLVSVIALFDGAVLPLDLDDVPVGDETRGHRFLGTGAIRVHDLAEYRDRLRAARVVVDAEEREWLIADGLERAAQALGVRVKPDPDLLAEVVGLVEWPEVLTGRIDAQFMDLPGEVLTTSMRTHQKYFSCLDADGKLAPHMLLVSNMTTPDFGAAIVAGNERVLRARLADARFFWDQDREMPLAARLPRLAERVFHAKLGTMLDKTGRMMRLVETIAARIGANAAQAARAAELAKADLSTGMVGEFPELQGIMGSYYARHDGEPPEVATAIAEHYAPQGPSDRCPSAPVSVAVALADKIDTLVAFFSVDEVPTGSRDPFALRRAALGVMRIIIENELRLPLKSVLHESYVIGRFPADPTDRLLRFIGERVAVELRTRGIRHDLIRAVFVRDVAGNRNAEPGIESSLEDDLVRLVKRVDALAHFLDSADGGNLLTAYRRGANIVKIEERKDGAVHGGDPDPSLFTLKEEDILHARLGTARRDSGAALDREDFEEAMGILAQLRGPVDEFFNKVTVNCDDQALRANRLRLLARMRDTLNGVADFSLIEG